MRKDVSIGMRRLATIAIAAVALVSAVVAAQTSEPDLENLGRSVGRSLVEGRHAQRAGVRHMLPLSCPPFQLLDEKGEPIVPHQEETTLQPVSTKRTCGQCHDYDTITRGYHFRMGCDELYAPTPADTTRGVDRGPGYFGKWDVLDQRELAPKEFSNPEDIDLTPFEWIQNSGILHPGGGPAEYDRAWNRYDEALAKDRGLALFGDSDYYESPWLDTGVVEADCFICHLDTYNYSIRAQQMKKQNFRWAATAAAGLGVVSGAVRDGDRPDVHYRKDLFDADGKVHLQIQRPTDRQCLPCHDMLGIERQGSTWHTPYMQDVHIQRGMTCTDCHPGDIRHHFAKGNSPGLTTRDDLDGGMMSCEGCHTTGEMGAPAYDHPGLPPLHFKWLTCEACHITKRSYLPALVIDTTTGEAMVHAAMTDSAFIASNMYRFGAYWGMIQKTHGEAPLVSFETSTFERAATAVEAQFGDDTQSDAAVALMLKTLEAGLPTGEDATVVRVHRGKAYHLVQDTLRALDVSVGRWPQVGDIVESNVAYARRADNGRVFPCSYQLGAFWLYEKDAISRPLFVKDMKKAWDFLTSGEFRFYRYPAAPAQGDAVELPAAAGTSEEDLRAAIGRKLAAYGEDEREFLTVYDDDSDGQPEVNTEEEIGLMAWALARTMTRVDDPALSFVCGLRQDHVRIEAPPDPYAGSLADMPRLADEPFLAIERYTWDPADERWEYAETRLTHALQYTIHEEWNVLAKPFAKRYVRPLSHGVKPASQALGANGCGDCHASRSPFFLASSLGQPWTYSGRSLNEPNYAALGYSMEGIEVGFFREDTLKPLARRLMPVALVVLALHFVLFGAKRPSRGHDESVVLRLRAHERLAHFAMLGAVGFLTLTAVCFLWGKRDPLGPWARDVHTRLGWPVALAVAGMLFARIARPPFRYLAARLVPSLASYVARRRRHRTGRFNIGQRAFFWFVITMIPFQLVTGFCMMVYMSSSTPDPMGTHIAAWAYTLHDVAALAIIFALMGHIYMGLFVYPHSLRSLFGGKVSAGWARTHHPAWKALSALESPPPIDTHAGGVEQPVAGAPESPAEPPREIPPEKARALPRKRRKK